MNKFLENRNFQLWEYKVSHGSLLIRSAKKGEQTKNIDIIFSGIEYIALPRHLSNLTFENVTDDEVKSLGLIRGKLPIKEKVYVLQDNEKRYLVVAAGMKIVPNELDIFDSPFS